MKRIWSKEEIDFLKGNIGDMKLSTIAKILSRTESAVVVKAKRMGLGNTKSCQSDISIGELARLIQKDRKSIYHWIKTLQFPVRKRITKNKRAFYFVNPESFWEWAFQYKEKLDFSLIEANSIPPEPEWVRTEREYDLLHRHKGKCYRQWTSLEMKKLVQLHHDGYNCTTISKKLNRTVPSVTRKLKRIPLDHC